MNSRGFTLMELLAVIVLVGVIIAITSIPVVNNLKNAKQKSLEILKGNIESSAKTYYNECRYSYNDSLCSGKFNSSNTLNIKVSDLVDMEFLSVEGNKATDPTNDADLSDCNLQVSYDSSIGDIKVKDDTSNGCGLFN